MGREVKKMPERLQTSGRRYASKTSAVRVDNLPHVHLTSNTCNTCVFWLPRHYSAEFGPCRYYGKHAGLNTHFKSFCAEYQDRERELKKKAGQ
jgi:hypothetical protein